MCNTSALTVNKRKAYKILVRKPTGERRQLEDLGIDGRIKIKLVVSIQYESNGKLPPRT